MGFSNIFRVLPLRRAMLAASALAISAVMPAQASAESLFDALSTAYINNPTIRADRARQRGTDEQVPQALSGWRPTVSVSGQVGRKRFNDNSTSILTGKAIAPVTTDPRDVTITLEQPVFRGFRTTSQTALAEANVRAGRANLSSTEQSVLLQAVAAYMNVVRDRRIVSLREQDVNVLQEQLKAANARFNVGEITRTDVAQARASLSLSQSNLALARAQLASSSSQYEQIVGNKPGSLKAPGIPKTLPPNLDAALAAAEKANPDVIASLFIEEAARKEIGVVRADLLPSASLIAQHTQSANQSNDQGNRASVSYVYGSVQFPLYEGGRTYSGVREAKQVASQRRIQVIETQRDVRQAVISAWNNYLAAGQNIAASAEQVKASQLALEGVRQEALVGSRTTLDVLNAQKDVVSAQVQLAQAERDRIVTAYQVIATTGKLTPSEIGLSVPNYDPTVNYQNTRFKLIGTGTDQVE